MVTTAWRGSAPAGEFRNYSQYDFQTSGLYFRIVHRKMFLSESQLSLIVKSSLVELKQIPVKENHVHTVEQTNINLVTEK